MRILYIVTAFPRSSVDVITPWLTETITRLRAKGIEVEVLAPSYRGLGSQLLDGTVVHRFRYAPAPLETLTHDQTAPDRIRERPAYAALLPGYLLGGSLAATRLARSGRFDAIHAFWPLPHGLLGLIARRFSGVPLISTFFGVELTWVRRELPFLAPLVRRIIRQSDAVTVISSATGREVQKLAPGAVIRTIPFGAASAPPEPGAEAARSASSSAYRLLFVGRLVERKGVEVLIRAVEQVRRGRDVRLTIVGEGPLRRPLEELARTLGLDGVVDFPGQVSAVELERHYEQSDAFVLPAVEDSKGDVEGLGVVLLEAMGHGKPVIASASGGIPDIVEHERTGLLVEPGNVSELAGAIIRLASDPGLASRLVRDGRSHLDRRFSWESIIGSLEQLYSEVSATGRDRKARAL